MARPTLCVACADLPLKDRGAAARTQRCADCHAEVGVTAYGARFRLPEVKRRQLSATFIKAMPIGAGLFMFATLIVGVTCWINDQTARPTRKVEATLPDSLARVREVSLLDPFPSDISANEGKQRLIALVGRIKAENNVKVDGFMIAQIDRRKELRGLPFVMGDACRMQQGAANLFQSSVLAVRDGLERDFNGRRSNAQPDPHHSGFWNTYAAHDQQGLNSENGIAALTQMLGPERLTLRHGFVQKLANSNNPQATKALAKAAVFDPSGEVRLAAINALQGRPRAEYTDILMQGMRYPMASVASNAGQAIIELKRDDLLPQLVAFLGEAAPGDPEEKIVEEKNVCMVREVVRINHHRNCLMCHAPTSTGQQNEVPGVLPIPGSPFPESPRDAYGNAQSTGDPMVRADTTYLRQDFSVMLPVANAAPWPELQRFDFLVRSRVVEGDELKALQQRVADRAADFLSANHRAAVQVLRELTGRDAAPNQAAWQRVLAKE